MEYVKACYSMAKLNEAADMVKSIDKTVKRKNEHFAKCIELEKVFQFAADNINRWLFDPDIELKEYKAASYNYKAFTKQKLDQMFNQEYRYICNELNGILTMIHSGEVDCTE